MNMITLTSSASYGNGGKQFIARVTGRDGKFTFARTFIGRKGGKRNEDCSADVDEPGLYECRDVDRKGRAQDSYHLLVETSSGLTSFCVEKEDAMKLAKELDAGRPFSEMIEVVEAVEPSPLWSAKNLRAVHVEKLATGADKDSEELIDVRTSPTVAHLGGPQGDQNWGKATRRAIREFRAAEVMRLDARIAELETAGEPEIALIEPGWRLVTAKQAEQRKAGATLDDAVEACVTALACLEPKQRKQALATLKARLAEDLR